MKYLTNESAVPLDTGDKKANSSQSIIRAFVYVADVSPSCFPVTMATLTNCERRIRHFYSSKQKSWSAGYRDAGAPGHTVE